MLRKFMFLMLVAGLIAGAPAQAATYKVDADHTTVSFKVRHLFSKVEGQFTKFDGSFVYDPEKPESWAASGKIDVASINTNVKERDKHLLSADFFDVEKFPAIEFKTVKIIESSKEHAKIEGLFKMHGVEKPIILDVDIHGVGKDPWGNIRSGFTVSTKINRKDFSLAYNQALETGQLLIGEEVEITIELEGIQQ